MRSPNETAWLQRSKAYAAACAAKHGDLLPHLSTRNAVRDMDTLRRALKVSASRAPGPMCRASGRHFLGPDSEFIALDLST